LPLSTTDARRSAKTALPEQYLEHKDLFFERSCGPQADLLVAIPARGRRGPRRHRNRRRIVAAHSAPWPFIGATSAAPQWCRDGTTGGCIGANASVEHTRRASVIPIVKAWWKDLLHRCSAVEVSDFSNPRLLQRKRFGIIV
jgi:hypothetical protein